MKSCAVEGADGDRAPTSHPNDIAITKRIARATVKMTATTSAKTDEKLAIEGANKATLTTGTGCAKRNASKTKQENSTEEQRNAKRPLL